MVRVWLIGLLLLLVPLTNTATASVTSALLAAGDALDIAAQGVQLFAEHISALEQSTSETYDPAAVRRARVRLGAYVVTATEPSSKQGHSANNPVDRYLHNPNLENWTRAKRELTTILMSTLNLLHDVKQVRSDFVNESMFQRLLRYGEGSGSIPDQFALLIPAVSPQELETMKHVRDKYWTLWNDLARTNMLLAEYLRRRADSTNH